MNSIEQEDLLQKIVEHTQTAIEVIDKNRIIRYANTADAIIRGVADPKDLIGKSLDDILLHFSLCGTDGEPISAEDLPSRRAFTKGIETRDMLIEQIRGDFHRWLEVSCVPVKDEEGNVVFAILYYLDISHRKLSEDKLTFLVENSKILSLTTDFRTRLIEKARHAVPSLADWCTVNIVNHDRTLSRIVIVHRDPSKVSLVEELANRSIHETDQQTGIYHVMRTGKPQFIPHISLDPEEDIENNVRLKLIKELKVCSSMIIPIKSEGRVLGILSLAYSDSGRQYTEKDMEFFQDFCHHLGILFHNARLYDQISEKDKAKDAFLATLSHELRNPLAPIKSSLELVSIKNTDPELSKELSLIEHQFSHMTKLLGELLDVTRYTQGKISLNRSEIELGSLVERIADSHRPLLQSKGIQLESRVPEEDTFVTADETRLEQALRNILHNAIKFTPEGGNVSITLAKDASFAHIEIRDTGEGVDTIDLEHIFEGSPNYLGKTEHPQRGLGIGLILVREITRLHEGVVKAHSDGPGLGSSFTISLPLCKAC